MTAEFERLGDHAENIASRISRSGTSFSAYAQEEIRVVEEVIFRILEYAEQSFEKRNEKAARLIEPLVQVTEELVSQMRRNHLRRMSGGICNINADVSFENLLVEIQRVAAVCSNIGIATVVRIHPELADHEHIYYTNLHSGKNEEYNRMLEEAYDLYNSKMQAVGDKWKPLLEKEEALD